MVAVEDLDVELSLTAEREAVVQAWVVRHDDDLLRSALDKLPPGPLHRWTVGVKDVIDTADLPTERGSDVYRGRTPGVDAACVALARRAGGLVVGKTATTEFAMSNPTVTTNPHERRRTPGGSSSGSAAAVAAGMVRVAFGTQTVGSVLRPAAFCGVVGFKPTHQLVPLTGVASLAPTLDTVGWMSRSVVDSAAVFEAMTRSRPDLDDRPITIGRFRSPQWPKATPEGAAEFDRVLGRLAEVGAEARIHVVDVDPLPHLEPVERAANTVFRYEAARVFGWELEHHRELIAPATVDILERSQSIQLDAYQQAQLDLEQARRRHHDWWSAHDIDGLLTLSAPGEAPSIDTTGDPAFNRIWTSLGVPALHLPTGVGPNGLPLGVQLTGTRWSDTSLLATGAKLEKVLGPLDS